MTAYWQSHSLPCFYLDLLGGDALTEKRDGVSQLVHTRRQALAPLAGCRDELRLAGMRVGERLPQLEKAVGADVLEPYVPPMTTVVPSSRAMGSLGGFQYLYRRVRSSRDDCHR
jgi:hypothetical protein